MCELDTMDGPSFYRFSRPVARKQHQCDDCGVLIHKGEQYVTAVWCYDSDMRSGKCCLACDKVGDAYGEAHEATPFPGGIQEAVLECFQEEYREGGYWMRWGRHLVRMKRRAKEIHRG